MRSLGLAWYVALTEECFESDIGEKGFQLAESATDRLAYRNPARVCEGRGTSHRWDETARAEWELLPAVVDLEWRKGLRRVGVVPEKEMT